uniref:Uncharacterized protein n=1 Tax=Strigamia maritima TaxID=126957 RepID=T1IM29_STRMM
MLNLAETVTFKKKAAFVDVAMSAFLILMKEARAISIFSMVCQSLLYANQELSVASTLIHVEPAFLGTRRGRKLPSPASLWPPLGLQNSAPESFHVKFWAAALQLVKALRFRAPPPFVAGNTNSSKRHLVPITTTSAKALPYNSFMQLYKCIHYWFAMFIRIIGSWKVKRLIKRIKFFMRVPHAEIVLAVETP